MLYEELDGGQGLADARGLSASAHRHVDEEPAVEVVRGVEVGEDVGEQPCHERVPLLLAQPVPYRAGDRPPGSLVVAGADGLLEVVGEGAALGSIRGSTGEVPQAPGRQAGTLDQGDSGGQSGPPALFGPSPGGGGIEGIGAHEKVQIGLGPAELVDQSSEALGQRDALPVGIGARGGLAGGAEEAGPGALGHAQGQSHGPGVAQAGPSTVGCLERGGVGDLLHRQHVRVEPAGVSQLAEQQRQLVQARGQRAEQRRDRKEPPQRAGLGREGVDDGVQGAVGPVGVLGRGEGGVDEQSEGRLGGRHVGIEPIRGLGDRVNVRLDQLAGEVTVQVERQGQRLDDPGRG